MTDNTQDGFDAIEYPLDYSFKAVCDKSVNSGASLEAQLEKAITDVLGAVELKGMKSKESSTGKYVSITMVATLNSREELEGVYSSLSQCDAVRMTL